MQTQTVQAGSGCCYAHGRRHGTCAHAQFLRPFPVAQVAYAAYRALYNEAIYMGLEVPPESWGGNILTLSAVDSLSTSVRASGMASSL